MYAENAGTLIFALGKPPTPGVALVASMKSPQQHIQFFIIAG
jgi:hypothetical protein